MERIVFYERNSDGEARQVLEFTPPNDWSGERSAEMFVKEELAFKQVDIKETERVLRLFSGSRFWAALATPVS